MCKTVREGEFYVIYRVNVLSIIHHVQLILLDPTKILLRVGLCQNL